MTTDATTSLRPAARAAGHSQAPAFVATLAPQPIAPPAARVYTGAVAASVKAAAAASEELAGRPRAAARAASAVAPG